MNFRWKILGDKAIIVDFSDESDERSGDEVESLCVFLNDSRVEGIVDWIPSYHSLTVIYDPMVTSPALILEILKNFSESPVCSKNPKIVEIPVIYGGEYGPDIESVAKINDLTVEEVVKIHSSAKYKIEMIGFLPGFPYLSGMSSRIKAPRLERPRTHVPAGSVGIAGDRSGIYPLDSPGGWQIIGRTPLKLFDPERKPSILFDTGDIIKFVEIDPKRYEEICHISS